MSKPKSDYTIQTVSNALRLLEAFYEEAELGVSELSRRLGLHKNNVFRLLATLELGGYVEQSTDPARYRLGVRCLELGRAYARSHSLVERARPVLGKLVEELGETAHLGVLRDFEVVHLDGIQPLRLLVTASRVGQRLPVHCSALGKVLGACADTSVLESYERLRRQYDWIVVEGAGSPAEINLRDRDIANMGLAGDVDCPALLIADIDRGGVVAQIVGTLELLSASERDRIIGFVINRFRGDLSMLEPGLRRLEERTDKPVFGV